MKLLAVTLLLLCPCLGQTRGSGPAVIRQVSTGDNSPNVSNVTGSVTITYTCSSVPTPAYYTSGTVAADFGIPGLHVGDTPPPSLYGTNYAAVTSGVSIVADTSKSAYVAWKLPGYPAPDASSPLGSLSSNPQWITVAESVPDLRAGGFNSLIIPGTASDIRLAGSPDAGFHGTGIDNAFGVPMVGSIFKPTESTDNGLAIISPGTSSQIGVSSSSSQPLITFNGTHSDVSAGLTPGTSIGLTLSTSDGHITGQPGLSMNKAGADDSALNQILRGINQPVIIANDHAGGLLTVQAVLTIWGSGNAFDHGNTNPANILTTTSTDTTIASSAGNNSYALTSMASLDIRPARATGLATGGFNADTALFSGISGAPPFDSPSSAGGNLFPYSGTFGTLYSALLDVKHLADQSAERGTHPSSLLRRISERTQSAIEAAGIRIP